LSVVIVNFEAGQHLAECVRAALQSPAAEVLVVDNASSDDSLGAVRALAERDPRLRVLQNPENRGFARASNQGLAATGGEYVLFLNPDCTVPPATLPRMLAVMEAHPEAAMAGCLVMNPDGSEQPGCRRETPTPAKALVRAFRLPQRFGARGYLLAGRPLPSAPTDVEAISGAFMLVRRSAINEVGPLDEGYFLHCEDLDWCLRFRQSGWHILFVPDVTAVHAKGVSSRRRPLRVLWHMHRGMIRYYRKFFRKEYPAPLFWLVVAAVAARFVGLSALTMIRLPRGAGR
jgi:GT2 family glycosyltransferase